MGYFSNGTEGMDYVAQWCDRCIHQNGPEGKSGCAVWLAHVLHNYKECNNEDSILHLLIPREGLGNGQCKLFVESSRVHKGTMSPEAQEWADKHGIVGVKQ